MRKQKKSSAKTPPVGSNRSQGEREEWMRIGLVSESFAPFVPGGAEVHVVGGAEFHALELSKTLIRLGHEVFVLTIKFEDVATDETRDKIVIRRFKPLFPSRLAKTIQIDPYSLFESYKLIKEHQLDIIHAHEFMWMSLAPVLAANLLKVPVVATLHTYWPICLLNNLCYHHGHVCRGYDRQECSLCLAQRFSEIYGFRIPPALLRGIVEAVMRSRKILLKGVDEFIVPAKKAAECLTTLGVKEEKIRLIPHGISLEEFTPKVAHCTNLWKPLKISKDKKIILFVGNLIKVKGVDYLIRALPQILRRIPEAALVLVGDGPETGNLTRLVHRLKLTDEVIFAGKVEKSSLPQLYPLADVCVIPSLSEVAPYVALEAMAMKKPVVASRVGNLPELIAEKTGILVNPEDSGSLAEAVIRLLSDRELRRKMGEAGRRHVERNHTVQIMASNIVNLYTHVIEKNGKRIGA
jgi:glycosyltransferase involved in cell wall biosynthesis